jgi:hypothetical protein
MVRLLLEDMIRRVPVWPTIFFVLMFAVAWTVFSFSGPATYAIAASLTMAFASGPFWIPGRAETPLIPYLPVSRRDVWLATWVMSTIVPVALTTVLKVPGTIAGYLSGEGALGFSSLTLSSVMDFLYVGGACAVVAASGISNLAPAATPRSRGFVGLAILTLFGGTFLGFVVHRQLPTGWSDLSFPHGIIMAGCLVMTVAGYRYTPMVRRAPFRPQTAAQARPAASLVREGALSRLPRLIGHELAFTAGMCLVMLVTMLTVAALAGGFSRTVKGPAELLGSQHLLVFAAERFPPANREFGVFGQLGWYAFFIACVSVRFPDAIRHLRVLPVRSWTLHVLLIAWPALIWTLAWLLLGLIHLAVIGWGPVATLQIPLLLALVGISALAQSLGLRFQTWVSRLAGGGFMVIPFARLAGGVSPYWLLSVATIGIAAAVALNNQALSRAETYKRTNVLATRLQRMS